MNNELTPIYELNLKSERAQKARLGARIGHGGHSVLVATTIVLIVAAGCALSVHYTAIAGILAGIAIITGMLAAWWQYDLNLPSAAGNQLADRISSEALGLLPTGKELTPLDTWKALAKHWQTNFILHRLLLPGTMIEQQMSPEPYDMSAVWSNAVALADKTGSHTIEVGHIAGALIVTPPQMAGMFSQMKLAIADVDTIVSWLIRAIDMTREDKPDFGGIGRDWANGFTPILNQYGLNISLAIERSGSHYGWLMQSPGVEAIKNAFSQGAGAVALIGDPGIGKTSHVSALAQLLLQEGKDRNLEHRQIISLNSSLILSSAARPGDLEHIMISMLNEAAHAGHIILFLDDAQQFFSGGTGTFDASQILLPVLQSRAVQLVLAMTPHDYQALKARNSTFASMMTPVVLQAPPEADVMRVLEDSTLGFEHRHKVLISYEALREAYRLSGRYEQEMAYPGKAILLLEQSLSYARNAIVTAESVQQAIEQTRGVKVSSAAPAESDTLLHLEDKIHERMINQTRAVSVVASALRRARAGVSNPKRPIGSFLFLGPTGVGKTELAKAIAATYFSSEANMIRLDMSEYQQPEDVARLLSDGQDEHKSLIMSVRQQPFSVVLLDEIEKAHPNILNLLLQLLDEGALTDIAGRAASFKDCIIIATSNAGADTIRERIEQGQELEAFEKTFIDELISSNQFKPELLNRFDEIVLFRPLKADELGQVVALMLTEVNKTLENQNISVELTPAAIGRIVEVGYDARLGARPMRRTLQRGVEDTIADKILRGEASPGSHIILDAPDLKV